MSKLARRIEAEHKTGSALAPHAWPSLFVPGLVEEFERMFQDMFRPWWPGLLTSAEAPEPPAIDVFEEGEAFVLEAELPGLKKEEVDVELAGDVVTISGKKEKEVKVERNCYYRCERAAGEFVRSVTLPVEVEPSAATAQLKDGVLEVRMPKKQGTPPKSRKITVA